MGAAAAAAAANRSTVGSSAETAAGAVSNVLKCGFIE